MVLVLQFSHVIDTGLPLLKTWLIALGSIHYTLLKYMLCLQLINR